jgi:hypothetical protein
VDISAGEASSHLTVDIEKSHLQPGEKSEVRITWKDRAAGTYHVRIAISPVGQQLDIETIAK